MKYRGYYPALCYTPDRLTLESILLGHENLVTSVRWMSNGMLLSASMDKTLIVWQQVQPFNMFNIYSIIMILGRMSLLLYSLL